MVLGLLVAVLRIPLLNIPLERDEGEYAYIAWRLEHNELPYRDWVDQKPPGVFWVYRAALSLPMPPVPAIHVVAAAFSALTACALFLMMRMLAGQGWALMASALFVLLSADPRIQGTAANTEVFMLLPLTLSQWLFLYCGPQNRRRWAVILACGVLTGVAVAFKQVAAAIWPFQVILYPFFFRVEKRWRSAFSFGALSLAGILMVWGGIAGYFHARNGLGALVYNVLTHNLEYINAIPWTERLKLCEKTLGELARTQGIAWLFAIIGLIAVWRTGRTAQVLFLAQWLVAGVLGVSASGYFFPHYFQQLLPTLCALAALGAEAISKAGFLQRASAWRNGMLGAGLLALPGIFVTPFLLTEKPEEASRKIYPGSFCAEMQEMGRRLAEVTKPEDRVYVFGAEAEVLFYGRCVSATRYIFLFPLYGPYRDAREKQMATAQEISANQPAALLYLPNSLFLVKGTEQFLTQWTQNYMKENFKADLWLAVDQNGKGRLLTGGDGIIPPRLPPGERVLGGLFLRKAESANTAGATKAE
jgi:4-amino-4-deoxy-L-arabinose transferase-like glycosyltransferase